MNLHTATGAVVHAPYVPTEAHPLWHGTVCNPEGRGGRGGYGMAEIHYYTTSRPVTCKACLKRMKL